jgi:hypothetical protein
MSRAGVVKFNVARKSVQIGAQVGKDGKVAVGVSVGEGYAAAIVTPAKAESIAAELSDAANRLRAAAKAARRRVKPGILARFFRFGRG